VVSAEVQQYTPQTAWPDFGVKNVAAGDKMQPMCGGMSLLYAMCHLNNSRHAYIHAGL